MVGKKKLVGNVNNVASYIVAHNSPNVPHKRPSGSSVVKRVRFIGEKAKHHTCRYFKTMRESINAVFHALVVIGRVAVEIAEFRNVPL